MSGAFINSKASPAIVLSSSNEAVFLLDDLVRAAGFTREEYKELTRSWCDLGISDHSDIGDGNGRMLFTLGITCDWLLNEDVVHPDRWGRLQALLNQIEQQFGKGCWIVCAGPGACGYKSSSFSSKSS